MEGGAVVYRATRFPATFDPLDAAASVARGGWRFNDRNTEVIYAATVQSLAILDVVARPGWESGAELAVVAISLPGAVVSLDALGIVLPPDWNSRPPTHSARRVASQFLAAVDRAARFGSTLSGLLVPSVISSTDMNVLLDPRQKGNFSVAAPLRLDFEWSAPRP